MDKKQYAGYIFMSLFFIMVLTLCLNWIMNYDFIQSQLEKNIALNLENERANIEIQVLQILKSDMTDENAIFNVFDGRENPQSYNIQIFNNSGLVVAGNTDVGKVILNTVTKEMFNNATRTFKEDGYFYSYSNMSIKDNVYYLLLTQTDQGYVQEMRSYYLRMIISFMIISAIIILLGFKIIQKISL